MTSDQKVAERARCEQNLQSSQHDGDRETRENEYLTKQIRQAQSVSLNQSEKMAEIREKIAAKEDSNEAARYQIKSMQAEID